MGWDDTFEERDVRGVYSNVHIVISDIQILHKYGAMRGVGRYYLGENAAEGPPKLDGIGWGGCTASLRPLYL